MSWIHFTRNHRAARDLEAREQKWQAERERLFRTIRSLEQKVDAAEADAREPIFKKGQRLGKIIIHDVRKLSPEDRAAAGLTGLIVGIAGVLLKTRKGFDYGKGRFEAAFSRYRYRCSDSETDELVSISEKELLRYVIETINNPETNGKKE